MNNTNKYNKKRAKILLKGVIPSLISLLLIKNKKRIIFNSTRNEFYNFNTKYLFEYFIELHPEYEVKFVINNARKRLELNNLFGVENNYFIETESLKGMFFALKSAVWVTSAFETPVGGVLLNKNRFVYHLGHGTHFKAIVFNENNLSLKKKLYYRLMKFNFSSYLTTSQALVDIYKKAYDCGEEKLNIAGEPRHDKLFVPREAINQKVFGNSFSSSKNILYAPTWRPYGTIKLFPFDDIEWDIFSKFLEKNSITFYLRMHPSFQEDLDFYTEKSDRIKILDNLAIEDISDVLGSFDLLITDYSSIQISYLLLNKPVLFLPYDLEQYKEEMGFIKDYNELTPGPKPETFDDFHNEILRLLKDEDYYND